MEVTKWLKPSVACRSIRCQVYSCSFINKIVGKDIGDWERDFIEGAAAGFQPPQHDLPASRL
jgi:hypothetical protein